jgi:hypothetical protein
MTDCATPLDVWVPRDDCGETHEWRSATGETIRFVTRWSDVVARMMPPVSLRTIRVPQAQGARFRGARHDERLLPLPVVAPGGQAGREEVRRWARALDPLVGEGTLTVVVGPWAGRQLICAYEGGLEGMNESHPRHADITLLFHASNPYWHDSVESSLIATLSDSSLPWFPFAGTWEAQPLDLGASDVFAQVVITNTGDVDAWPVITTTGPGVDLTATNLTTGLSWRFAGDIAAGSELVVDTRPGHKTVRLDGFNAFSRLTDQSVLWPLVPGPNTITLGFATATAASQVRFAWQNRYLSA